MVTGKKVKGMGAIRKLARGVAKANMRKAGMKQVCKKDRHIDTCKIGSYFSIYWRDYAKK